MKKIITTILGIILACGCICYWWIWASWREVSLSVFVLGILGSLIPGLLLICYGHGSENILLIVGKYLLVIAGVLVVGYLLVLYLRGSNLDI